jgi:hypothetical protein
MLKFDKVEAISTLGHNNTILAIGLCTFMQNSNIIIVNKDERKNIRSDIIDYIIDL